MSILAALWLPIVLSAVFVFILSAIIHMVIKYHNSDYQKLPNEDAVRSAFRGANVPPGQYIIPWCKDMKDMETPEMKQKFNEGPVAVVRVRPSGPQSMGPSLSQWFLYCLMVSLFVAYVASRAVPPGSVYIDVFRIVAGVAILAYAAGQLPGAIWMGKPWSVAAKEVFDGVLYGLVTAGTFGWLWPR